MTSDPRTEHRLTRLENDRDSLYDLMRIFRVETRAQFAKVDRRLDRIDRRLDKHDALFAEHTSRFDQHDARFDRIDGTLAEILRRLPASA